MKTLDQVEARIPIDATRTPGDASATFRITAPGSYYLTGNITGQSGKVGILVLANDVTIDLNGFSLIGAGNSAGIARLPEHLRRRTPLSATAQLQTGNLALACATRRVSNA
jgi:hypothetical protein